jgi:type I site-specific restriction endonuclease
VQKLNLPDCKLVTKESEGQIRVLDFVRQKFVALTAEEWVRQHFLYFMVFHRQFPKGLIKVEQKVVISGMPQRADIVAHSKTGNPLMVVECKAPGVNLSRETFAQAARYNLTVKAPYLTITNGLNHFCCKIDLANGKFTFLDEFPSFTEIDEE